MISEIPLGESKMMILGINPEKRVLDSWIIGDPPLEKRQLFGLDALHLLLYSLAED